jgi:hypothetical protein
MKPRIELLPMCGLALILISTPLLLGQKHEAPCDIYAAGGTPCVAAHSTTRAMYGSYSGPLYQLLRQADGKTLDIGMIAGGYADAGAQDAFCANTLCFINLIYDQSGKGNHLYQAPPGPSFRGPAKGAFDTQPIADMAPITIGGHKAYGVYIMPGMGFRNNNASGIAIGDEPEGIYYVIDGTHYDSGCCFDYGNASTNGRAVGTGTMETTYFGTSTAWGSGAGFGPWIMSDMEAGLFSGYNAKQNAADPTIDSWRFVTAVVDGGGGNKWDLRGGNAQKGGLTTFYSGVRPGSETNGAYYPMHKQGAILLGTGGDNGNGSSGTFYEGAMTVGYPTQATTDAVQANIVAARYEVARVSLSRVTTFTPQSTEQVTETFTNSTGAPVAGLKMSLSAPTGWTTGKAVTIAGPIAPGVSVSGTFSITSPPRSGAGFLTGKAEWTGNAGGSDTATARIRNVMPVKINEVRFSAGGNATNQFIELYNAGTEPIDISNWTLVHTPSQWASIQLISIPAGTKLASHGFYLAGLAGSGLASAARAGDAIIHIRSAAGFEAGQTIDIDGETRTVRNVGTAAAPATTIFIPVSTGPWLNFAAGSTNLAVANTGGFEAGQKIGIDLGGNYEVATVTAIGKAATQTTLAASAAAGVTNIKVAADSNLSVGETLTVGTGPRKELVKVANIGTNGSGVGLATPLKFDHSSGVDVSGVGTGVSFSPGTRFPHRSGDAVQALGSGLTLDRPLARNHEYGAPIVNRAATAEGYVGPPGPNQWFGAALSPNAGSIALMEAGGVVVDAMVYGSQQSNSSANGTIASPELAVLEGDQGRGGCIAIAPAGAGRGAPADTSDRSVGRFPDGADTDSNCNDFLLQTATVMRAASPAGASNIKVASVAEFQAGQTILIDRAANRESATIATVGTPGSATVGTATTAGATVIPVDSALGFIAGQTIMIDSGANQETAAIAMVAGGGRGGRGGGPTITVAAPLHFAHAAGAPVAGSGITLTGRLTKAHESGTQVAGDVPTPGAPNRYSKRR